jgi:head-tail adaptor
VARAIGDAIAMEMNHGRDALATKGELIEVRDDFKREISDFRGEVKREFAAVRSEMAQEMSAVRAEMAQGFAALRLEMAQEFAAVRLETKQEFVIVRAEIQVAAAETKTELMRFMFSALIGQTALLVGIMYFMIQHLR